MKYNSKSVYLYDLNYNLICKFDTTRECAIFFNYEREYINHNLKYCKKIRKDKKWYIISRDEIRDIMKYKIERQLERIDNEQK